MNKPIVAIEFFMYVNTKLVHGTGLAGLSFKFFFPVPPGNGTDSAR